MKPPEIQVSSPSPFRRRRFVAPHRRRSLLLMLARPFLTALLLVGLPVAGGAWVITSPRFLLSNIVISGTSRVQPAEVGEALQPLQGKHLLLISLTDVEGRLSENLWIEGANLRKKMPDSLVVEVKERQPVMLLRSEEGLFYVDRAGTVIDLYDPAREADLLLLSVAPGARLEVEPALAVAAELELVAPDWASGLSEVEVLGGDDFRLFTASLPFPVLVSLGGVGRQVRKFRQVMPEITRRYDRVSAVDLRFSRQIVIQPAADPRSQEG
jgi:cell division septal protein FtsQ